MVVGGVVGVVRCCVDLEGFGGCCVDLGKVRLGSIVVVSV